MNGLPTTLLILLTLLLSSLAPGDSVAKAAPVSASEAEKLIEQSGIKGGLVVHVGLSDGKLTAALKANSRYQVHGIDREIQKVALRVNSLRLLRRLGVRRVQLRQLLLGQRALSFSLLLLLLLFALPLLELRHSHLGRERVRAPPPGAHPHTQT